MVAISTEREEGSTNEIGLKNPHKNAQFVYSETVKPGGSDSTGLFSKLQAVQNKEPQVLRPRPAVGSISQTKTGQEIKSRAEINHLGISAKPEDCQCGLCVP